MTPPYSDSTLLPPLSSVRPGYTAGLSRHTATAITAPIFTEPAYNATIAATHSMFTLLTASL